jgi:hypothetical protein
MPPPLPNEPLIAGQFAIDFTRPLPGAGGGLPAFAAADRREERSGLMAVQLRRYLPARADALHTLTGLTVEGLVTPLGHGVVRLPDGAENGFLVCTAPPGPPLSERPRPWAETDLLGQVLRPVARVLDQLAQRGVTHRAIRTDNVFRAGPGQPVVLGCAWATPPAMLQPSVSEPPYVAMCHPAGRGDGTIADDIYALGVLLLTLALGQPPLAGLSETDALRQKLDLGSHAALVGDHRLSSFLSDLLRGMLAEDPDHRPPPAMLLDSAAARSRRIAGRPPHRGQKPILIGGQTCWHARTLAHALATQPAEGARALKTGAVEHWLRRGLGDGLLASRLEDQLGLRAAASPDVARDSLQALMQAVTILDPLAPMCWDGLVLWPDGIGPVLACAQDPALADGASITDRIAAAVTAEAPIAWNAVRLDQGNAARVRQDTRQAATLLHAAGAADGIQRLLYQLNPLLPCLGAELSGRWVVRLVDLLPALEDGLRRNGGKTPPIDHVLAAYIGTRGDRRLDGEVRRLEAADHRAAPMARLRLLAQLQARYHQRPLRVLGGWVASQADALLVAWRSRARREEMRPHLVDAAERGDLIAALALLEDPRAREQDEQDAHAAAMELARIDATLARLATGGPERAEQARRLGQEIAAGIGLSALAMLLIIAALG